MDKTKESKPIIEDVEDDDDDEFGLDPTLEWVEQSDSLHWIFVGGKGGVGKTTVSCSLSIQLAKRRPDKRILLISTDPAHNVSDALSIKIGSEPTTVPGVPNLQAMEIDSKANMQSLMGGKGGEDATSDPTANNPLSGTPFGQIINQLLPDLKDASSSMPGIDEAMSFAEIMQNVNNMQYDIVIFDTAPTGHTLRLLAMPESVQKLLTKVLSMKSLIMPALSAFMGPAAGAGGAGGFAEQEEKMQKGLGVINSIVEQFKNPDVTTFIPVMIPEFLSLYETERLIQDLHKFNMDVSTIVINQIVPAACAKGCSMCKARGKIQNKYIDQAFELYEEDYHIVRMPLGDHEVRGVKMLEQFGEDLFKPSPLLPSIDYEDDEEEEDEEKK